MQVNKALSASKDPMQHEQRASSVMSAIEEQAESN